MKMNNQKSKRKFRSSKKWKEFRQKLKEERKVCEVTGNKLTKMFQVHHEDLREEFYEELDEDKFSVLSWNMHKCVHYLFVRSKPREWRRRVLNLIRILKRMEKYLT